MVTLRPRAPEDDAAITALTMAAFGTGPADEAAIITGVRAEGAALVELVAVEDDEIVGHVLFNRMRCDPPADIAGLAPVSVSPARQGAGIGDALIRAGLAACRDLGSTGAVVLGHPDYYPRFGFSRDAALPLQCRYSASPAFMAAALTPGGLAGVRAVAYPHAFD